MKKTLLLCFCGLCMSAVFASTSQAEEEITSWSGSFINAETGVMMHNNSVRINKMGIGFFPTGFFKSEAQSEAFCTGIVALGEDLQARVSNYMFFTYEMSQDENTIIVSRDTQVPMEGGTECTEMLYGVYVRQ